MTLPIGWFQSIPASQNNDRGLSVQLWQSHSQWSAKCDTEDQGEDEVEEKAGYSSLRDTGLCKSTPTLSVSGPEAPARLYTPLALILLFWETSVAAFACEGKGYKY